MEAANAQLLRHNFCDMKYLAPSDALITYPAFHESRVLVVSALLVDITRCAFHEFSRTDVMAASSRRGP